MDKIIKCYIQWISHDSSENLFAKSQFSIEFNMTKVMLHKILSVIFCGKMYKQAVIEADVLYKESVCDLLKCTEINFSGKMYSSLIYHKLWRYINDYHNRTVYSNCLTF